MPDGYTIIERAPAVEEYRALCTAVGWAPELNFEAAAKALENSLYAVVVVWEDKTIGMGRIIGDGAVYLSLEDIVVFPEHQGKGVGAMIVERLMSYLNENAPDRAVVSLRAVRGTVPFYARFGFCTFPADGDTAMSQVLGEDRAHE